jgi:PAS domain S-box-containing protein
MDKQTWIFKQFLDHTPAASWITDGNGVFLYINKTYCNELYGETEDFIGKSIYDVFPPEVAEHYHKNIIATVKANAPQQWLEEAVLADGSKGKFLIYKFPICG